MEKQLQNAAPKKRKRFLAVDVWRSKFGKISEKAIYEIYASTFGISQENMKKKTFTECVNGLRSYENPDYVPPTNQSHVLVTNE